MRQNSLTENTPIPTDTRVGTTPVKNLRRTNTKYNTPNKIHQRKYPDIRQPVSPEKQPIHTKKT